MKDKTIFLEAAQEKNRLKIGLYSPGDVIWRYEELPASMERIRERCKEILETLNVTSRNGGGGPEAYERLMAIGRMLGDELLTPNIKDSIAKSDAQYLILKLDDHLVHIPWELLCVGEDFLCQQFCMGRSVKTRQSIAKTGTRTMKRPLKMWILANPKGDLEVADTEGLRIFQDMARMNQGSDIISPCLDADISPDQIKENIKGYDFVHFAGHVDYHTHNPAKSGWRLTEGNFSVNDIDRMAGGAPMPALVFSNACQSARTETWDWDESGDDSSFGLPNAFLRSGVRHYVGTCWEIMDEPSSYFAHEFYRLLREGATTGEAVREARRNLTEKFGPDICWASYLLYGDPTVRYFRKEKDRKTRQRPSPAFRPVTRQNILTRGSLFNYSLNSENLKWFSKFLIAAVLLISIAMAAMAGIFTDRYLDHVEAGVVDDRMERARQILITRAEQQQQRTDRLFQELVDLTRSLPVLNRNATEPLTMVTVFDSQSIQNSRQKIILHAVQDQILKSDSPFRMLEQQSFDIVLEELLRKIELTPSDRRTRPNLLVPRIILILEAYDTGPDTLVLMRLVDKDSRRILDTLFVELKNDKRILDQKEKLAAELIKKLKTYETQYET